MRSSELNSKGDSSGVVTREIHHVSVDGEGSVTIVEFHCDGECHRLLIRVSGSSVSAEWIDEATVSRLSRIG